MTAHDVHDVALRQLETALKLYIKGEDYYSVVTLAGAAEELFGQLLKDSDGQNAMDSLKQDVAAIHRALYNEDLSEKVIVKRANQERNALKHWGPGKPTAFESDTQQEAKDLLDRAVNNYYGLTGYLTPEMQRFQSMHTGNNAHVRPAFDEGVRD